MYYTINYLKNGYIVSKTTNLMTFHRQELPYARPKIQYSVSKVQLMQII